MSHVIFPEITQPDPTCLGTMLNKILSVVILFSLSFPKTSVFSQTEQKLTARDLFLSTETASASPGVKPGPGPKSNGQVLKTVASAPLGLRCSIVKQVRDNQVEEVDPDTIFHSGDRIRLSIVSNESGYLYVVARGSSGRWNLLFPSREILGGKNTIEKGDRHEIPLGDLWIAFDTQPGIEKVFLVLARQPEPDLEKLARPSGQERESASALDNAAVGKIRSQVAARDLVFEKVSSATSGEKALYVVNPTGNADARVVVDLSLTHR